MKSASIQASSRRLHSGKPRETRGSPSLFTVPGERKYLNGGERDRVLAAIGSLEPPALTFVLTIFWTGARVSEVLALTPEAVDLDEKVITILTLKRRKHHIRQVPIPPFLVELLDRYFVIRHLQGSPLLRQQRLWGFCRQTAWRLVKRVMGRAGIQGVRATPKGFRHAFGVAALHADVPLNVLQRWMGHARLETTAIYLVASGPDELVFAERMWTRCRASILDRHISQ